MSRILIDLDGCVCKFQEGFRDCVAEQQHISYEFAKETMLLPPSNWAFYRNWGLTDEQFLEMMSYAIRYQDLFLRLDPYEGALEVLWELHKAGHELVAVSARKYGPETEAWAYYQTLRWLELHQAPPMEVILTNQGQKKSEVANRLELEYALEDSLDSFMDLAKPECLLEASLMDRPWNRDCEPWVNEDRVCSWGEFVEKVR